jgi:Rho-binding antiterminator
MEPKDTYTPIACGFYDLFEIAGMRKEEVELVLKNEDRIQGRIETLRTIKGEGEFVLMKSGQEIRLDMVKSINGEKSIGYC